MDPLVLEQHLKWSKEANIGLWIAAFFAANGDSDVVLRSTILPELKDIKVSLLYDMEYRINASDGWNLTNVQHDVAHMCSYYFGQDRYFSLNKRAVVFVKMTRIWYNHGILSAIVDAMRSTAWEHGYDLYLVGDQIWGNAPTNAKLPSICYARCGDQL